MYPALLRYMTILFLNMLTLLASTQAADNLFHSFTVLCENENFLISSLHCFFANVMRREVHISETPLFWDCDHSGLISKYKFV